MNRARWEPLEPRRAVRTGSMTTLLVLIVIAGYSVASPGATGPGFWGITAAALAVSAATLVYLDRIKSFGHWSLQYAWTLLGLALMTAFVAVAADGHAERWILLYAILAVSSSFHYPRAGQLMIQSSGGAALFVLLLLRSDLTVPDAIFVLAMYVVLARFAAELARGAQDVAGQVRAARSEIEMQSRLLAAAGSLNQLDVTSVLEGVCDAVISLGFDRAAIGELTPDGAAVVLLASRGEQAGSYPDRLERGQGVAGQVLDRGETVSVGDYGRHRLAVAGLRGSKIRAAIGVPVRCDDEIAAVFVASRLRSGAITPLQIRMVEQLADEAGRALENARRYAAERELVARLQRLDELKVDFVSSVSHELRTPLTVVRGLGETLLVRGDAIHPELRQELLSRIGAAAERLNLLIESLLDFSRLEGGSVELARQTVNLTEVLGACVGEIDELDRVGQVPANGTVDLAGHPVTIALGVEEIEGDRALLQRLLVTLVHNAVLHTAEGTPIEVSARRDDDRVHLAVTDFGPGIPAEDLPFVTDRFFRGGKSTTRSTQGLGLGLAMADQIVRLHGGELTVHSAPGEGTRIDVALGRATVLGATPNGQRSTL